MNIPTTKAEIDALQPGRETDVLVCEITGLEPRILGKQKEYPPVSTNDAAAITYLLPLCIQPEENFLCISLAGPEADGGWGATLGYNPLGFGLGATADSLAMAMCKAFLLFKLPISGEG